MKTYTIKEIAAMAQVSVGTVDRVLHNRGSVHPEKEKRIRQILKQIDYRPNLLARSLKMNRRFRVVVLMPDAAIDGYWQPCYEAMETLRVSLQERSVFVEALKYAPDSPDDFLEKSGKAMELAPDAVLLGALFQHESQHFLLELQQQSIQVCLINTLVQDATYNCFVGQNLQQSGRTAAHLLNKLRENRSPVLVLHLEESFENAFHMQQKEKGFREFFKNSIEVKTLNINKTDTHHIAEVLSDRLHEVSAIFVTTSKAWLLCDALPGLNAPVIGYDLLPKNIEYLRRGKIDFLIYQNPGEQFRQGMEMLVQHLQQKNDTPHQKLLPIEIISPENIDSYPV